MLNKIKDCFKYIFDTDLIIIGISFIAGLIMIIGLLIGMLQ